MNIMGPPIVAIGKRLKQAQLLAQRQVPKQAQRLAQRLVVRRLQSPLRLRLLLLRSFAQA